MPQFTIVVALLVATQSGLTPATVRDVQQQVASIYSDASVRIQWAGPPVPGGLVVDLLRALPPIPGCESAFGCSVVDRLGTTPPVAYVSIDAIYQHELGNPLLRGRMLAYVVAHELGHLIGLAHTDERGIMHRNSEWLPDVKWTQTERMALSAVLAAHPTFEAR